MWFVLSIYSCKLYNTCMMNKIHIPLVCESVLSLVRTIFHVNSIDHPPKQTKKNVNRKMAHTWYTSLRPYDPIFVESLPILYLFINMQLTNG